MHWRDLQPSSFTVHKQKVVSMSEWYAMASTRRSVCEFWNHRKLLAELISYEHEWDRNMQQWDRRFCLIPAHNSLIQLKLISHYISSSF